MYPIIMAGGGGTRLWPVSRQKIPKQTHALIGKDTLLQRTYKRLRKGFKKENILIATSEKQFSLIRKQLTEAPLKNYSQEPARKDTGTSLGLAVLKVYRRDPKAIVVNINSDAYVENEKEYIRILKLAERVIRKKPDHLVLIGINPTYPETGYGYIKMGSQVMRFSRNGKKADEVFAVEKFTEKPNFALAQKYLNQWEYLWNPTLIVAKAETLLKLFQKHLPKVYKGFLEIKKHLDTPKEKAAIKKIFPRLPAATIDYGILEKADEMLVLPADFGWADVGHWRTVKDILSKKSDENLIKGKYVGVDTKGCLVYSFTKKLITTVGLKDMVIIDTDDALLVCPKNRSQDVKKIVEELEKKGIYHQYL